MKEYSRYATGVLFIIGVIVLIIIGFNLIRNLFKDDSSTQQSPNRTVNLIEDGKAGKSVRFTVQGAVVGNEQHRSIRITVNPNNRRIDIVQGYNDQIIKSNETPNTQAAYDAFIAAIYGAGYTRRIESGDRGNEAQSCPQGMKYAFEIAPGTADAFRTWANSCRRNEGTFQGNRALIEQLFQRQIPNYNQFTSDVRLT